MNHRNDSYNRNRKQKITYNSQGALCTVLMRFAFLLCLLCPVLTANVIQDHKSNILFYRCIIPLFDLSFMPQPQIFIHYLCI